MATSPGKSDPRRVLNQTEKEKHIEQTLEQWGAPKKELRRQQPRGTTGRQHASSTRQIREAVEDWAGSSPKTRELRAREREEMRLKKERVKSVVTSWKDGPPFLHASLEDDEASDDGDTTHGQYGSPLGRRTLRRQSSRGGINARQVLQACWRMASRPRADDIWRMASQTSVGRLAAGSQSAGQVLAALARLLEDEPSLALLERYERHMEEPAGLLVLLPEPSPTSRVARLLARAGVAPLEHAMRDACRYPFNLVRQSWSVRVERFPSQTVVTHSRMERSAPGHDEQFEFGWSVSFLLRGQPLQLSELFVELTHLQVEGSKADRDRISREITDVFRRT